MCSQQRLLTTHLLAGSVSNNASAANGAVSVKHPTTLAINTPKSSEFDLAATVLLEPRYCCDSSHVNPSNVKRMSKSLDWTRCAVLSGSKWLTKRQQRQRLEMLSSRIARHEASIHANPRRKLWATLAAWNRRIIRITDRREIPHYSQRFVNMQIST